MKKFGENSDLEHIKEQFDKRKSFQLTVEEYDELIKNGRINFRGHVIEGMPFISDTKVGDVSTVVVARNDKALPEGKIKIESMSERNPDGSREMVFVLIKD